MKRKVRIMKRALREGRDVMIYTNSTKHGTFHEGGESVEDTAVKRGRNDGNSGVALNMGALDISDAEFPQPIILP